MIDIVDYIKTKAEAHNWIPIVANASSVQYEVQKLNLTDGTNFVYIIPPSYEQSIERGEHNGEVVMDLRIAIGRKFDPNQSTFSSIGETMQQKYDNRLFYLANTMYSFLLELFQCSNDYTLISSPVFESILNAYSTNADMVLSVVRCKAINQWPQ